MNEIVAALTQCYALACEGAWQLLLDAASDALVLIRKRSASRNLEPDFLAHVAAAQIELGNPAAGRAAAAESVGIMRETQYAWTVHSYAVLARAQFALREPAADIAATLDEYAALLERTAFHLHAGELYELRARLAEREGHAADRIAALQSAHDCYTSFGMTNQAARIAAAIG